MSDRKPIDVAALAAEVTSEATQRLELYGAIVESLPDALVVANESGSIVIMNAQAELMFGYHRNELLRKPVDLLIPEAQRQAHGMTLRGYFAEPRVRMMGAGLGLQGQHKSGAVFPVEIMLSPIVTTTGVYAIAVIRRRR